MAKQPLVPVGLARPGGPFSHGVKSGQFVFVAGQVAIDSEGRTVGVGDIRAQTRKVLENVREVLKAAGATMDDVVKVTVFLTDMGQIAGVQEVRPDFFQPPYPASTLVQVSQLVNPEWMLEIEAIAVVEE